MTAPKRWAVQNLIGGVSQQPPSTRLENQCEVQDDAYSSVVDGLGKRQPVEHVRTLEELVGTVVGDQSLVHWINRDSSERYAVVIDPTAFADQVKIYDATDGTEMTVTGAGGGAIPQSVKDYLDAAVPRTDLRALTVADTTFLVNRTVTCKMNESKLSDALDVSPNATPDWRSRSSRRFFLFWQSTNTLKKYAVRVTTKTGPLHPSSPNTVDPPVNTAAEREAAIAWTKTFSGDFTKPNGDVNHYPPYNPAGNEFEGYQVPTVQVAELFENLFLDVELPVPPAAYNSRYPGGIKQVSLNERVLTYAIHEIIRINASTQIPPVAGPTMKFELHYYPKNNDQIYRESINVEVVEEGEAGALSAFSDEVQRIDQLPLYCEHGHVVKITGIEDTDADEYYVEFVMTDHDPVVNQDNMGAGYWKESRAPLSTYEIDASTMPHELVRVPDGSQPKGFRFELREATWDDRLVGDDESNPLPSFIDSTITDIFFHKDRLGVLTGSKVVFSEAKEFRNWWRTSVKQLLDSDPIDLDAGHRRVANLRFAVPLEETLILFTDRSQFVVRADGVLSPRTASVSVVTEYESLPDLEPVAMEKGIFFGYGSGGGAYSRVRQLERIQDSDAFRAFEASGQIPRYIKGQVIEMTASSEERVLAVRTLDDDHRHSIWIYKWWDEQGQRILSSWMRYRVGPGYLRESTGLHDTRVLGMQFIDSDLMLLTERGRHSLEHQVCLEKITIQDQRGKDVYPEHAEDDTGNGTATSAYRTLLDRRVTDNDCLITYDDPTESVLIQLPYLVQSDTESATVRMRVMTRKSPAGGADAEGRELEIAAETQVTVSGVRFSVLRISDKDRALWISLGSPTSVDQNKAGRLTRLYIGQDFEMVYRFSEAVLRERLPNGAQGAIRTGHLQLLRGFLAFEDTAGMTIEVVPAQNAEGNPVVDRQTSTTVLPTVDLGIGATELGRINVRNGVQSFAIMSKPSQTRITVRNGTPFPCNIKSLEYEALYRRASRTHRGS